MDPRRFDQLARSLARHASRRGVLGVLLGGALGGGAMRATAKPAHARDQPTFLICHNGKTLQLPAPAAKAHLAHGDTAGPCGSVEGSGTCVPLLQVCVPLVGKPCCDAAAACVVSDAGAAAGIPDFACRDTGAACTSDAACHARYANPDVVCRPNDGGGFCRKGIPGDASCCAPNACAESGDCFHGLCCKPFIGPITCCAAGQFCNRLGGCFTG